MKRTSKKWRTGCTGLLSLLGTCVVLYWLFPPSTQPTAVRQAPALPLAVNTPGPTVSPASVLVITDTPLPTLPPVALPTVTPEPTDTQAPTATPAPLPTDTLAPTEEEAPTNTPEPLPTDTPLPLPTDTPTDVAPASNQAPTECLIKGNVNSKGDKIYHVPGDRDYSRTKVKPEEGDQWFCTEADAQAAGFRAPNH